MKKNAPKESSCFHVTVCWVLVTKQESSLHPHLQIIQEPSEVQAPLGSIPVVVGADIFEASISKYTVVVLWKRKRSAGVYHLNPL